MLLEKGARTKIKEGMFPLGRAALQLAAQKGHANLVRSLLELGADTEAKSRQHDTTAPHLAVENVHTNV